jgi:hypothetical protein
VVRRSFSTLLAFLVTWLPFLIWVDAAGVESYLLLRPTTTTLSLVSFFYNAELETPNIETKKRNNHHNNKIIRER